MEATSIVFEDWESVLVTDVPADRQQPYREAIVKFTQWAGEAGKAPVAETFKEHLEGEKSCLSPEQFEIRREALRWCYKPSVFSVFAGVLAGRGWRMPSSTSS